MHDRMNNSADGQQQSSSQKTQPDNSAKGNVGEYIDFEEIKE